MKRIIAAIVVAALAMGCAEESNRAESVFLDEVHTGIASAIAAIADGDITMIATDIAALTGTTDESLLTITYGYCDTSLDDLRLAVTADYGIFLMRRDGNADAWSDDAFERLFTQSFFLKAKANETGLCEGAE